MICFNCKREKSTHEAWGKQIYQECEDIIAEGSDRFELELILNKRGEKWVMSEVAKYDSKNKIIL